MRKFVEQRQIEENPETVKLHYTPESLAIYLISKVPIQSDDVVLDPSAGANKVFYNNFPTNNKRFCEAHEGIDFLMEYFTEVDWIISNPPFHLFWRYVEHSSELARKGFAFLSSSNSFLSFTPKRLSFLANRRFALTSFTIVNVKKWFGRYYFVIFEKHKPSIVGWNEKSFED